VLVTKTRGNIAYVSWNCSQTEETFAAICMLREGTLCDLEAGTCLK
jgi:hypothetical protein